MNPVSPVPGQATSNIDETTQVGQVHSALVLFVLASGALSHCTFRRMIPAHQHQPIYDVVRGILVKIERILRNRVFPCHPGIVENSMGIVDIGRTRN
jgi:hypothetical protein